LIKGDEGRLRVVRCHSRNALADCCQVLTVGIAVRFSAKRRLHRANNNTIPCWTTVA
jgi:hypothetical protein